MGMTSKGEIKLFTWGLSLYIITFKFSQTSFHIYLSDEIKYVSFLLYIS